MSPLAIPAPGLEGAEAIGAVDAVALFVARATDADPGFELTDGNARVVATICRRLDGLPLAIELTAAQLSDSSLAEVADRLERTTSSTAHPGAGQVSLEETLSWSHETLSRPEQVLFARLAVFNGGFTPEAAQEVCAAPPLDAASVPGLLARLQVGRALGPTHRRRRCNPHAAATKSRTDAGSGTATDAPP